MLQKLPTKSPNPIDRHAGSRVCMRRKMLSMSQTKLADAIGLTFQQIQKYEKGTNRISASRLLQIAHVLQVPVSFFFEDRRGPLKETAARQVHSPDYVSDFITTADGLALTKSFVRIKDPQGPSPHSQSRSRDRRQGRLRQPQAEQGRTLLCLLRVIRQLPLLCNPSKAPLSSSTVLLGEPGAASQRVLIPPR
jgi:transcriptional regulator with XRE-family HTH domain